MRLPTSAAVVLLLGGCAGAGALGAGPLASLGGEVIVPAVAQVAAPDPEELVGRLGVDPAIAGVVTLRVKLENRTFVPLRLGPPAEAAFLGPRATEVAARALAPAEVAARIAARLRSLDAPLPDGGEAALAAALADAGLGPGEVPAGGRASGLLYVVPEAESRLDAVGLAGRFLGLPIAAGEGELRLLAGRLGPR